MFHIAPGCLKAIRTSRAAAIAPLRCYGWHASPSPRMSALVLSVIDQAHECAKLPAPLHGIVSELANLVGRHQACPNYTPYTVALQYTYSRTCFDPDIALLWILYE